MSPPAEEPAFRPGVAFAGIFAVTFSGLVAVGAVLPVLPRYVHGPLDGGNIAVGIVVGCYAVTGLMLRPLAGRFADRRGRKPAVLFGSILVALAGFLYLLPLGIAGLVGARLVLGAGEGTVFTAGSAWIVDLAPEDRRGRVIGLYGLAVWSGLSVGPLIGELLLHASGYTLVWLFAGAAPLVGAAIALRIPDPYRPHPSLETEHQPLIAREAVRPGAALALGSIGYACVAAFVVLHLDARGIGHGAAVFGAFATMVVLTRLVAGDLPDRVGPARVATGAALVEGVGLVTIGVAQSLPVAIVGALAMGTAFSLRYPVALADRGRTDSRDPPRRGARHLHSLLRRRGRDRGPARPGSPAALTDYEGAFLLSAAIAVVVGDGDRRDDRAPGAGPPRRRRPGRLRGRRRAGSGSPGRSARGGRKAPTRRCRSRSGAGGVTASTQIHSPSGRRSRFTVRSTLMKMYLRQSSTALIPLPTSAMTIVRCSGEGSSPSTRGTSWRIQISPGPVRGSRRGPIATPSPCGSRPPVRSGRSSASEPRSGAGGGSPRSATPAGRSRRHGCARRRPNQLALPVAQRRLDELDATPGPDDPGLHRDRADRHRAEDLEGDPPDLEVGGVLQALDRPADQRRRWARVL